jgi:hypothetical protein
LTLDRHSPPDAGIAQRGTLDAVIRRYAYHIEIDVLEEAIGFKLELSLRSGQEGFGIKLFDQQCNLPAHLPLALAKAVKISALERTQSGHPIEEHETSLVSTSDLNQA